MSVPYMADGYIFNAIKYSLTQRMGAAQAAIIATQRLAEGESVFAAAAGPEQAGNMVPAAEIEAGLLALKEWVDAL